MYNAEKININKIKRIYGILLTQNNNLDHLVPAIYKDIENNKVSQTTIDSLNEYLSEFEFAHNKIGKILLEGIDKQNLICYIRFMEVNR
jgi:hypothetical protein